MLINFSNIPGNTTILTKYKILVNQVPYTYSYGKNNNAYAYITWLLSSNELYVNIQLLDPKS